MAHHLWLPIVSHDRKNATSKGAKGASTHIFASADPAARLCDTAQECGRGKNGFQVGKELKPIVRRNGEIKRTQKPLMAVWLSKWAYDELLLPSTSKSKLTGTIALPRAENTMANNCLSMTS